jgi:hypothetical protein
MGDAAGGQIAESLATSVLSRVPALTDVMVATIQEQNPGYRRVNVVGRDDLWKSCHDNVTRVLELISGTAGEDVPESARERYYDAARTTGQRRAEQRMPLDDVLRSFRLGGRLVWEALIDQAREDGSVDTDALLDVATRVWEVVDAISAQVAFAYHAAERQLVRADERRRAMLWEGLLQGRAKDLAFAHEAGRIVGVPVDGPYAVVAIDLREESEGSAALLGERLSTQGVQSAWQVRANTLVGLLALNTPELGETLAALRESATTTAGVSLVVDGLAAIDVAYRQALLARRTIVPGRVEVAALEARLPEALLLGSPEIAERLVLQWLGPLLRVPVAERRLLLDTLEAWVATTGSATRTAELVHCHRNTVINRMHRIHEVTGHDFTAVAPHLELSLALRASWLLAPGPLA